MMTEPGSIRKNYQTIEIIDSHTGGEPTRTVIAGGPPLVGESLAAMKENFATHFDHYRSAIILEPRGSEVIVGALLVPPTRSDCVAGVIFFNNVGYLNMCGHGTIGVAETLHHLGRITTGTYQLETPVGVVPFSRTEDGVVQLDNVPSYRYRASVVVDVPKIGNVTGDIAWGGNWFFLIANHGQELHPQDAEQLTDYCIAVRDALASQEITGENGGYIDHVELFCPPVYPENNSKNFVLCPGKVFDRSPCGTGTSAKLACLYADGKLKPGMIWRQESIIGSVFEGEVTLRDNQLIPTIRGRAHITAHSYLMISSNDPLGYGFTV
ncbi:MAG: proline racemase family protein [Zavarzinella sp.]